jgi:hypothetical protein
MIAAVSIAGQEVVSVSFQLSVGQEKQIAELFHAHPHSFRFRDLLGLWH